MRTRLRREDGMGTGNDEEGEEAGTCSCSTERVRRRPPTRYSQSGNLPATSMAPLSAKGSWGGCRASIAGWRNGAAGALMIASRMRASLPPFAAPGSETYATPDCLPVFLLPAAEIMKRHNDASQGKRLCSASLQSHSSRRSPSCVKPSWW